MKHSYRYLARLTLIMPLVVAALVSFTSASTAAPIKIGFFAPESGFAAADGQSAYDSAKLAVADINKAGGINGRQIQLINYDDASDAKQAVSIATRLVTQDKVDAVVSGSYSDQTLAAAPIFLLMAFRCSPPMRSTPASGSRTVLIFQQDFNGVVEGKAAAVALVKNLGATKIAIVAIKNDFGTALVQGFTAEAAALGATIVATDFNQFGEKDFTPILMRDQAKGATGYFMVEYYSEGQQFLNNWNTIGLSVPMVGTEGVDSTTQFFQPVGAQANGLVFTTPFNRDSTEPVVVNYIKDFTATYGYAPDMVGATTYDSFLVLKGAMMKGTTASQIRNGIAGVMDFVGVTGTILKYNATGEVVKAVELQIVKDGLPHHYGIVDDPAVITP